ncbi:FAD-dependent oxidoreductase [Spiroplasma endosymbiont of Labia minor]|uniref:FAD-dependent oxidoreductase n=1 Tax=Spiroplasma endosymbiont of Labia minor TaxID=3066305 RepID=UPI0030CBFE7F
MKVIVLGLNHAGTVATRTLKRLDKNVQVTAYERNDVISFLGCGIALWVKNEVKDPKGLFYASPELLKSEGIDVKDNHEWVGIDKENKTVSVKNLKTGEIFEDKYDKLIVASGSWPICPPIPGINLDNIQICKNYYQAQEIKAANENKQLNNIVIIGAGYIGVELVDAFVSAGKNVVLIDVADRIMPAYYDKDTTDVVEDLMRKNGVTIALNQKVIEFKGNEKVQFVVTDKGQYEVDYVVFSMGIKAETALLKNVIDTTDKGVIKTNKYMQTSDQDIYAIGDCAEVESAILKENMQIALATTAVRSGIIAAINIIKNNSLPQMGFTGANAICVFDYNMASVGFSVEMCKKLNLEYETILFTDNDRPEFMSTCTPVNIRLIWNKKTRKIIGSQIYSKANHTEMIHMLSLAIQKELTIDELPLVDMFFLPHYNKPYNFVTLAALEALGLNYFKN